MYGIIITLQPGRCLSQLLELRNEYRVKFAGQLPKVILSQADYDLLSSEYPVRNYGNVVHGMSVIVLREWEAMPFIADCDLLPKEFDEGIVRPAAFGEAVVKKQGTVVSDDPKPIRKKPGRKPKGRK